MTYDKRIAFVARSQHLSESSGIAQFAKGFYDMCNTLNYKVDFILDQGEKNNYVISHILEDDMGYVADRPLSYGTHRKRHVFTESVMYEAVVNFRESFYKAMEHHLYDLIICNDLEGLLAIYATGIQKVIPIVFYTHHEQSVFLDTDHKSKVFASQYQNMLKAALDYPKITLATQSDWNYERITKNLPNQSVKCLPMPLPEKDLIGGHEVKDKDGLLFIGRCDVVKNPKEFLRVAKETGLKPLILTNTNGEKKFRRLMDEMGIKKALIKTNIIGQEKVDFIKKAMFAYHPSFLETYGFCVFESLHCCPTFALDEYGWHKNFEGMIQVATRKNIVDKINKMKKVDRKVLVQSYYPQLMRLHTKTLQVWGEFIESHQIKLNDKDILKGQDFMSVTDYYANRAKLSSGGSRSVCVDDIISLAKCPHHIRYEKNHTYICRDESVVPQKLEDLFF